MNLAIANAVRTRESAADGVSEGGRFRDGAPCGGLEGRASESGEAAGDDKFFLNVSICTLRLQLKGQKLN